MKKGRGRNKGHGFERKAAKIFSDWSDRQFKRVPLSGGFDKEIITGDIFCVDEYGPKDPKDRVWLPISIECKCSESWKFVHFFTKTDKSTLNQWWQQSSDDAKQNGKCPTLVFTKNNFPIFIMLSTKTFNMCSVGFCKDLTSVGSAQLSIHLIYFNIIACTLLVYVFF